MIGNSILKGLFIMTTLCGFSAYGGDIFSTRCELSEYAYENDAVLASYDRLSEKWRQYSEQTGDFWDLDRLLLAVDYAADKHEGQYRKDPEHTPYIVHPLGLCEILWDVGEVRSVNILVAALLHDTLEDTAATAEEIAERFGERVLSTVLEVTNDPLHSSQESKAAQVRHAPHMSHDAQLVKLADRIYNLQDCLGERRPAAWSQEKVDRYVEWGVRLRWALVGTNSPLETLLEGVIEDHKSMR